MRAPERQSRDECEFENPIAQINTGFSKEVALRVLGLGIRGPHVFYDGVIISIRGDGDLAVASLNYREMDEDARSRMCELALFVQERYGDNNLDEGVSL